MSIGTVTVARAAAVIGLAWGLAAPALHGQAAPPPQPPSRTLAPANGPAAQFGAGIQKYMALRTSVEAKLPKVSETSDPQKIVERASLLAKGLQTARKDAKPGDIFTPAVAAEFRRILAADAAARSPVDRASLMAEVPQKTPLVNALYPMDTADGQGILPTFPAKLLGVLPELPESVEYRFLGKALVLRDTLANLIIDFLPDIAPAKGMGPVTRTHW